MAVKQNNDGNQSPGVGLNNPSGGGFVKMCEDDETGSGGSGGGSGGGGGGGAVGVGAVAGVNGVSVITENVKSEALTLNESLDRYIKNELIEENDDDDDIDDDASSTDTLTISGNNTGTSSSSSSSYPSRKDINQIVELIHIIESGNLKIHKNDLINMYHHIIIELSNVHVPKENLQDFKDKILRVGNFFAAVNDKNLYFFFIRQVYYLMTQNNNVTPSSSIAIIFELFDKDSISEAVHSLLDLNIPDEQPRRTIALLSYWLRSTNFCNNLHLWIMALLTGIKNRNKIELFNSICLENIESLFVSTILPVLRPKVAPVVFFMLTNVFDTPVVFHKIIPKCRSVISTLKIQAHNLNPSGKETKAYLQRLIDLLYGLRVRFYGHESLCKLLEETLKEFSPSFNYLSYAKVPSGNGGDSDDELVRGSKSKVGLVNLGNTCYMNCVLQALAMTKEFSREIILSKSPAPLVTKMQEQIALMLYSLRYEITPLTILNVARPPDFVRGLQHDSSEFLSYLLDTLHEQEVAYRNKSNIIIQEIEIPTSEAGVNANAIDPPCSPLRIKDANAQFEAEFLNDNNACLAGLSSSSSSPAFDNNNLWNITIPICSLDTPSSTEDSDFSNCTIIQMEFDDNYDTSLSGIIDTGNLIETSNVSLISTPLTEIVNTANVITLEGVDDNSLDDSTLLTSTNVSPVNVNTTTTTTTSTSTTTSASSPSPAQANSANQEPTIVDVTFSGKIVTTYKCLFCTWKSRNVDTFRDLQLSFPDDQLNSTTVRNYAVQDLLDFYSSPEQMTGDNKYFCDNCKQLRDAERLINFVSAPKNLILTLKHFRYDTVCHMRAKLMHKVYHDEKVFLNVCSTEQDSEAKVLVYDLYACVVHSGYSMDSGHYFTYASDASNHWYKFDDNIVTPANLDELHNLSSPNTPYILFYRLSGQALENMDNNLIATPILPMKTIQPLKIDELPMEIRTLVIQDNNAYNDELKSRRYQLNNAYKPKLDNVIRRDNYGDEDDDDDNDLQPMGGGCGPNNNDFINRFIY